MSLPPLPDSAITVGAHAADWREAVELAGQALARWGLQSEAVARAETNPPGLPSF